MIPSNFTMRAMKRVCKFYDEKFEYLEKYKFQKTKFKPNFLRIAKHDP